jgi:AraC-like DNA-binding protein
MKLSLQIDNADQSRHELELPVIPLTDSKVYRDEGYMDIGFGQGHFQHLNMGGIYIFWGDFTIAQNLRVKGSTDMKSVGMSFHLQGDLKGKMEGLGDEMLVRANEQMLCYTPVNSGTYDFVGNQTYSTFDVNFSLAYFEQLVARYPDLLTDFYDKVIKQEPIMLGGGNMPITPEMRMIVHELMHQPKDRNLRRIFVEAKVLELLALQVELSQQRSSPTIKTKTIINSSQDLRKMHEAKEILLARADNPPTIYELAKMVGTNDFKLKKGFKEVFGNTIFGFLLDFKMEKGRKLLRYTNKTTSEIAHLLGYSHPGHFTSAFKKKFGITPSALRGA